ncbi:MAG: isoleucine--tRNA ligase [Chloroflexi bacterium]|nr:isoleucine--tRNA ligase [Chloroflexota bacterium]
MFKPVSSKPSFMELEESIVQFWREARAFERSLELRQGGPMFTLYEGPPTANGLPGVHHVLSRVFKDIIPRYKTMKGFYCPRKGGWDTHGLPVELEVERELGFKSKADIEAYGVDRFNARCRESVFRYVKEWETLTERIGFWLDMANAYVTLDNDYIETVWWIINQLWEKGLVYQGYKVTPHCPRCGTSLSSHEVALGYRDDAVDPSVYVKFRLTGYDATRRARRAFDNSFDRLREHGEPVYFLAWTTTPWTLPANTALAVSPRATYVLVEVDGSNGRERLVLAEARLSALGKEYRELARFSGAELVRLQYEALFRQPDANSAYCVVAGDFVAMDEGTGIVHIAPAYGEIDLEVGRTEGLPLVHTVDLQGVVAEGLPGGGKFVKEADPLITEDLQRRGLLLRSGTITHTYPFCWRCSSPLLYYAKSSWYIQTTAVKEELIRGNEEIAWYPEHIKRGRFGDWLENNVDWALSRERYWGTPFPVWRCEVCGHQEAVISRGELKARPGVEGWRDDLDLHRPYIDAVTFSCPQCEGRMRRHPEVIDCWFDSGAMPFAQFHYPFENHTLVEDGRFPADYICEAVDQTRGWFYSLHAISTLIAGRPSYRNVICLGHILDEQGEKMSKSKGNVVDPWQVINTYGADALRWYLYTASPAGSARRFSLGLVGEVVRGFFLTLWNTYSFFVTYASIDGFDLWVHAPPAGPTAELDRWVLSRLNRLIAGVTEDLDHYDPTSAGRRIQDFVEELSNWYVRRSRRRFWKSENDADKWAAYSTLHQCLVTLSKLMAPFTPFLAEGIYRNLVCTWDSAAPESVHWADFPVADARLMDSALEEGMSLAMRASSLGRAARAQAAIKVRQPLSRALVKARTPTEREWLARLAHVVADELNVKEVAGLENEEQVVIWQIRPNTPVLGPKYGAKLREITQELAARQPAEVAALVRAGKPVDMGGVSLAPEEVLVAPKPQPGFAVAGEGDYLVAVSTDLTPALQDEGLARELVHLVQTMRKKAGFELTDRIVTYYQGEDTLRRVVDSFASYIQQETLSLRLVDGEPPSSAFIEQHKLDGVPATVGVVKQG